MIRVRNLTKSYGSHLAVDNISFSVEQGEIVGFLGPNGAGKSTTLRILTCYLPANAGAASVAGFDVFTQSMEVRRRIGYLPETNPLYPEMRVREFLNFRGKLRGMARDGRQSAIKRVTEQVRLGEFVDRPIGQLSKGMRQRVGLADALLHDPQVLVLDEPSIGLDPTQIREMRKLITELGKRHTIILSSHILPEVEATCHSTVIIAGGKIRASGTIDEVRERIKGASRILAEVRGPHENVKRAIEQIPGVRSVTTTPARDWNRLRVESGDGADVREQIASVAAQNQWGLRDLRLETGTLEEFFVQITAETVGGAAKR